MIDLVKVEDLSLKLLVHALVHVSRDLGQAELDKGLYNLVGVFNLVDSKVFLPAHLEPRLLC